MRLNVSFLTVNTVRLLAMTSTICLLCYCLYIVLFYLHDFLLFNGCISATPTVGAINVKGFQFCIFALQLAEFEPTPLVHCSTHSFSIMTNHAPHSAKSALYKALHHLSRNILTIQVKLKAVFKHVFNRVMVV